MFMYKSLIRWHLEHIWNSIKLTLPSQLQLNPIGDTEIPQMRKTRPVGTYVKAPVF
jgi:hypothetical protein